MYFFLFKVFNKKQWKCNCFLNKGNCRFLIFYKDIECKLFCIIWIIIKNKYLVCRLVVVNLRRPNWVIAVHCQCPLKLLACAHHHSSRTVWVVCSRVFSDSVTVNYIRQKKNSQLLLCMEKIQSCSRAHSNDHGPFMWQIINNRYSNMQ